MIHSFHCRVAHYSDSLPGYENLPQSEKDNIIKLITNPAFRLDELRISITFKRSTRL
jgi:hypothetical protein